MEVYQWLFRKNGFKVSPTGYFVFANADKGLAKFDGKLEFKMSIIAYEGDTGWIEPTIFQIHECLNSDVIPSSGEKCEYCDYRKLTHKFE